MRQRAYDRLTDKAGVHARLRDYFAKVPAPNKEKIDSMDDLAPVIELCHHLLRGGQYDEACGLFRDRLASLCYIFDSEHIRHVSSWCGDALPPHQQRRNRA